MTILLTNNSYHFELENVLRIFYPNEKIRITHESAEDSFLVHANADTGKSGTALSLSVKIDGEPLRETRETVPHDRPDLKDYCELVLSRMLFHILVDITGIKPPWGVLTGVRPAKLYRWMSKTEGLSTARDYFKRELEVSDGKIRLCEQVAERQNPILDLSSPRSFSLYVSIPFCPSRCAYCSFVSHSIDKAKRLIPAYVRLLCEELTLIARQARRLDLRLETVYFGGGTPTSLAAEDLERLFSIIKKEFDLSTVREYTVEVGRPDTVTTQKLECIRRSGANRVSINPQTMDDRILRRIGRGHTAEQVTGAYRLAREHGFAVNMDVIAGLPGDSEKGFAFTLNKILEMAPENITVHTLCTKRSSSLGGNPAEICGAEGQLAACILEKTEKDLYKAGYFPYYLYRQSKTVGNLENVGYAKSGFECLYNVYMMEEVQTVLAAGAGAVTKLCNGRDITRVYNFKYPYEYIDRFDEISGRKKQVDRFYETLQF
ncbi:MAG TPA: coproporphyrinogen dehydrogenase HemZ [Ruminococcaceae bacterium]|nr:coproporphyrinogen dehydrogenase HemZ [Oscillospiraceae bacterium]